MEDYKIGRTIDRFDYKERLVDNDNVNPLYQKWIGSPMYFSVLTRHDMLASSTNLTRRRMIPWKCLTIFQDISRELKLLV